MFSATTVTTVGLACKAFLNSGLCTITVKGFHNLWNALLCEDRNSGKGVITISNHLSVLDDPILWGILPTEAYGNSRLTRWALGASDIMFTNPVFSTFFRNGKVLETFRGKGIYQPAVDRAIEELNAGAWVHLFGEGKVNQVDAYPRKVGRSQLPRFKWGVGRIVMEAKTPPVIIPMWITGFDQLMPEGRRAPFKYVPKVGVRLSVTFGEPVPPEDVLAILQSKRVDIGRPDNWIERNATGGISGNEEAKKYVRDRIRSDITAILHDAVEQLGREVSGDFLGWEGNKWTNRL